MTAAMLPWATLFKLAVHTLDQLLIVAVDNDLGGETIAPLLREVAAMRHSEERVLASIRRDIQVLIEGPWHAGDLLLSEAAQHSLPVAARLEALEHARLRFIDACGNLVNDHFCRALVEYRIGMCYLCSGRSADARRWFAQAAASAELERADLERRTRWRRDHQHLIDQARNWVEQGAAAPFRRLPRIVRSVYGLGFMPHRLAAHGALSAYEQVVLHNQQARTCQQELQEVNAFLEALRGAGLSR
jgi:hypothetical protein